MSHYKDLKKQSFEYYKQWMKEKTFSKALGKQVLVSKLGWNHILGRKTKDRINRFNLLKSAKYIIKTSASITKSKVGNIQYITLGGEAFIKNKKWRIKVILKEDKNGNLIFYSVMKKA